jgi:hypothetical protein
MKKLLLILLCVPLMFSCGEDKNRTKSKESKACKCERYKKEKKQLLRGGEDEEQLKMIKKLEEKIKECKILEEETLEKGKEWECEKYLNQSNLKATTTESVPDISPNTLSTGDIDSRLFSFLSSSNFLSDGKRDLQEMIEFNNITLDSTIIEDLNEFPGCGCCDMTQYWNEDILYFKEGKVLIVEKHYDGDWESGIGDWYDCYLYSPYKKKFEKKLTLRNPLRFSYNYNTDYFIVEQSLVCDTEDTYYIIYNDKLEDVGDIWPVDVFGEIYFGWKEKTNEILLKYDRRAFKIYENTNQEWEIKEM